MIIEVSTTRGVPLGSVTVDDTGAVVGPPDAARIVQGALRLARGDRAALDGWTNGYVKLRAGA